MPSNKFLAVAGALTTAAVGASLIVYFSQQGSSNKLQQAGASGSLAGNGNDASSSVAVNTASFIAAAPKPTAWVRARPDPVPAPEPAASTRAVLNGDLVPSPKEEDTVSIPPITRQPLPVATSIAVVVRTRRPVVQEPASPSPSVVMPVIVPTPRASTSASSSASSGTARSTSVTSPAASTSTLSSSTTATAAGTGVPTQNDAEVDDNIIDSDAAIIVDANRGRPTSALITAIPTAVPTPPNRRPRTTSASATSTSTGSTRPTPTPGAPGNTNSTLPAPPKSCTFSFECPAATCCASGKCTPVAQTNGTCTPFAPRSAPLRILSRTACTRPPFECPGLTLPAALLADLARGDTKYTTPVANLTCPAQPIDRRNATQALACDTRKFTCGTCPTACGACPTQPPVVRSCARPGDVLLAIVDAGSEYTATLVKDLVAEKVPAGWFVAGDKLVGANAARFGPALGNALRSQPGMALGSMGVSHSAPAAFRSQPDHRADIVGAELVLSRLVPGNGPKFSRVFLAPSAANVSGAPLSLLATLGYTIVTPSVIVGDTIDRFGTPEAVMARVQAALAAQGAAPIVAIRDGSPWGMSMVRDLVKAVRDRRGRVVDLATCLGQAKAVYAATTSQ